LVLFLQIKKDLLLLVQSLEKDINKELKKKEYERILIYIALIYKTANLFFDYKIALAWYPRSEKPEYFQAIIKKLN
jgi:hypothetical protein